MIPKGLGQYDGEYAQSQCFWGTEPGKYVRLLCGHLQKGNVLDLGAGEGKNAIFLARLGFKVLAVECSQYAIRNFAVRLDSVDQAVRSRVTVIQKNVLEFVPEATFDAVIAYGLLHCLPTLAQVESTIKMIRRATSIGGFNAITTFTNKLPVPPAQDYLEPTLVSEGFLAEVYGGWEIVSYENDVIQETHPTTKVPHRHSLCRLLARRPYVRQP